MELSTPREQQIEELRRQIMEDAQDAIRFMPLIDPHPSHLRERAERLLQLANLLQIED